jgi:putative phage-type endonuclease
VTAIPHRYESREAWLRARRIGSSDVPALLGLSRYATAYDVWDRLVHGVVPSEPSADQERGIRLEPRVLATYAERTGRKVERTPPHTLYTRDAWATSTPDALADGRLVVEVKTDRKPERWGPEGTIERWDEIAATMVRPDYFLQVQHQLWTLDLWAADLAVLLPGEDPFLPELRVYRILRDEELVARLVARLVAWWHRHVVGREAPPLDDSDAAGRALARVERDGSRRATADEERLALAYATHAMEEKLAKEGKRRVGRELVVAAGGARQLELTAGQVTIVTGTSSTQLDEGALLEEHPELAAVLDRYRRPGQPYTYPRVTQRAGRTR